MPEIKIPDAYLENVICLRKKAKAAEDFIASVDWQELKQQYNWLERKIEYFRATGGDYPIPEQGIRNFLDAFKDLAVEHFSVPEDTAYTLTED